MGRRRSFENIKIFTKKRLRKYSFSSGGLFDRNQRNLTVKNVNEDEDSFRRNEKYTGLVSTQQIPLDNSKFYNNTFFGSAEVKINVAFEKIINQYPFDGSYADIEKFEDKLSSLEKYVLEKFPKSKGFIRLNSNKGQYITVVDKSGYLNENLVKGNLGISYLNPKENSFFLECTLRLPESSNNNSFLFYSVKSGEGNEKIGYAVFLRQSSNADTKSTIGFILMNGLEYSVVETSISKGFWHNLSFIYDRSSSQQKIYIRSVTNTLAESTFFKFNSIDTEDSAFHIGTGESINLGSFNFELPSSQNTFNGYLDEVRLFHVLRKNSEIEYYSKRNIFAHDNLKLLFRFNEPSGSYSNNDIVLDHSGKSLHSRINNFSNETVRENFEAGVENSMSLEDSMYNPILFPSHPDVIELNSSLLSEASEYDANNPNLITKLIPAHYLDEGAYLEGVSRDGDIVEGYSSSENLPQSGRLGSAQLISLFLYFMAEELDSYKIFVDQVSQFLHPDYLDESGVSSAFLPDLANYYGFELPQIFGDASFEQFLGRENYGTELGTYERSLSQVQNIIWRRVLKNLNHILNSKGTKYAIETIFRSSGIEPNRLFRLVEFNGKNEFRMGRSRQEITEMSTLLSFSGSLKEATPSEARVDGTFINSPTLLSAPLTGSRIEPGIPTISGGNVLASGSIKFHSTDLTAKPQVNSKITITDAFENSKTFQFVDGGSASGQNIPVSMSGLTTVQTLGVLTASLTSSFPNSFSIRTRRSEPGHNIDTINLSTNDFSRKNLGNHSITLADSTNITVDGFANGNGFINAGRIGYENSGISATPSDGLLTSGSWSVEGVYQFPSSLEKRVKRSLSRLVLSGTEGGNAWEKKFAVASNLVLSDNGESLTLYVRSSYPSSPSGMENKGLIKVQITGSQISMLDGQKWYVCYGRKRNDLIGNESKSSYFIRVASYDFNKLKSFTSTEKGFYEGDPKKNVFQTQTPLAGTNWSPPYLIIGSQSFAYGSSQQFLNDTVTSESTIPIDTKASYFDGKVGHIKFWSKALSENESIEHARNFKSVGTDDPLINNTFSTTSSGSFEKLRLNLSTDQLDLRTDSNGRLDLVDFSQNYTDKNLNLIVSGAYTSVSGGICFGFEPSNNIIKGERFDYTIISPFYDEYLGNDKIKIHGFSEGPNISLYNSKVAPVHEIFPWEKETNDNRFEVQIHIQRGLDEDIMNIFSSIDALDNALGKPELVFSQEYPNLRHMRNLYFNRLTEKVNYRNFFDLFRWLDDAFSDLIAQFVPRNNNFLGINLIIESHALERYKITYRHSDIYNDPDERAKLRSVLLVSQRSGVLRRF